MIKRIRIRGYKSLHDVEVTLEPLTLLIGSNGAGKSNLLDAIQLLSNIVRSRTLKEAFAPPYRGLPLESFAFDSDGLPGLLARDSALFSIEVDVSLSETAVNSVDRQIRDMRPPRGPEGEVRSEPATSSFVREANLRYRIEVEILPRTGVLRVADEYLAALTSDGQVSRKRRPFLEVLGNRLHLRMEGQAHPTYLERYLDHSVLSRPLYPPHYPHLVALQQELASCFIFYFEPRERMRASNPVKEVRHVGLMGEELAAFLNTLRALDPAQFKGIEKALHLMVPSANGIDVSVNPLGEVELRIIEGQTAVPARIVSEGTLRMLGLLALVGAKEPPALVGFEEPENGIHPRRIRMVAELLKSRAQGGKTQFLVTTHSPLLPDLLPDESLFICSKQDGRTTISRFSTWGDLHRSRAIGDALDKEGSSVSERILRGDFDA